MNKQELNTKYGKVVTNAYKGGMTHARVAVYIDTDSVKTCLPHVISHDNALCMYDYAEKIIEVLDNEKR